MKKVDYVALALATLLFGIIYVAAPRTSTIADEASIAGHGVDILGLTRNARNLPEEEYPPF